MSQMLVNWLCIAQRLKQSFSSLQNLETEFPLRPIQVLLVVSQQDGQLVAVGSDQVQESWILYVAFTVALDYYVLSCVPVVYRLDRK